MHQLDTGGYVMPTKGTLGEFLERWINDYAWPNTAPSTAEAYSIIVNRHLIPTLGAIHLTQLRPEHLQKYYANKLASGRHDGKGGLSQKTVKHHHRLIKEALGHAVKWGLVARNVADAVDPPKPRRIEMMTLDEDEVHRFLQAAQDTPYYALFYTALYTGMRRGELLALRWENVDLYMATLSVVRSLYRQKGGQFVISEPKTQRSCRMVDMTPDLAIVLRQHKAQQEAQVTLFAMSTPDLVFSHFDGSPFDPSTVSHAFGKIIKKAGLPPVRLHDLRHTHATLMLKQGVKRLRQ